jgi:hypothetical protein
VNQVIEYTDLLFKFKYVCIDGLIDETNLDVEDFKIEYCISDKKFKHVENNILFHYLFLNVIKLARSLDLEIGYKLVLFVTDKKLESKDLNLILQLKNLKKILPIPLLISVNQEEVFVGLYGKMKETNNRVLNFYSKRKVKFKEVKKYLDNKGFNTLSNTLSSMVDLKGFYY